MTYLDDNRTAPRDDAPIRTTRHPYDSAASGAGLGLAAGMRCLLALALVAMTGCADVPSAPPASQEPTVGGASVTTEAPVSSASVPFLGQLPALAHRSSPVLISADDVGGVFPCSDGETITACSARMMVAKGESFEALVGSSELVPAVGGVQSARMAKFTQRFKGVPVEQGWVVSVGRADGTGIERVMARVYAIPEELSVEPAITAAEAVALVPGLDEVTAVDKTILPLATTATSSGPRLVWNIRYLGSDAVPRVAWIGADSGELIAVTKVARAKTSKIEWSISDELSKDRWGGIKLVERRDDDDAQTIFAVITEMESWLTSSGLFTGKSLKDASIWNIYYNDLTPMCQNGAVGYHCVGPSDSCYDKNEIHLCLYSAGDMVGTIAHEGGHHIEYSLTGGGSWYYSYERESIAMVETCSQVTNIFFRDWAAKHSWLYPHGTYLPNGERWDNDWTDFDVDFKPIFTMTDMYSPNNQTDHKYHDAKVPGSALYDFYKAVQARTGSDETAHLTVQAIFLEAYDYFPSSGTPSISFLDYYSFLQAACKDLEGKEGTLPAGGTFTLADADCNDLEVSFQKVEIVPSPQAKPTPKDDERDDSLAAPTPDDRD